MKTNTIGNTCHILSSLSVLIYTIATTLYAKPSSTPNNQNMFDPDWLEHGFCIVQKTVPYFNTHDLCLYFDTILAILGLSVYYYLKHIYKTKNNQHYYYPADKMKNTDELMVFNMLGHLGHGVAHGFIAAKYRSGEAFDEDIMEYSTTMERYLSEEDCPEVWEIAKRTLVGFGFWFGLLKGIMPKLSFARVALVTVLVEFGGLFVRHTLGFAYVQAVLTVCFASTQLSLPSNEKDFGYAAFAAITIPLSIIPWIESMACQSVAVYFGGHLLFDAAIPILGTVAYVAVWRHYTSSSSSSLTGGKEKST